MLNKNKDKLHCPECWAGMSVQHDKDTGLAFHEIWISGEREVVICYPYSAHTGTKVEPDCPTCNGPFSRNHNKTRGCPVHGKTP